MTVGPRPERFTQLTRKLKRFKSPVAVLAGLALLTVSAFGQTGSSVTLAWNPSTSTQVAGYYLYYGAASGVYTNQLRPGNATQATVSGLKAGVRYYFAVTAYTTIGLESAYSGEISYAPSSPPILPAQTNIPWTDLTALRVINTATNPNIPAHSVTYQLVNRPSGVVIDTNGVITWTPTLAQSPTTNLITTIASTTDSTGSVTVSATNRFLVFVSGPYDGINLGDPTRAQADDDGDGLSNLIEYALGSDPRNQADATTGMTIRSTVASGRKYLTISFKERINASSLGLQYLPEVSSDRVNWASDSANVQVLQVQPLDSQFNWVTARDMTAFAIGQPRFIRLRVVSN